MIEFKDRLRTLIALSNLSIGQVAERSGVPKATLARWLNGDSPLVSNKYLPKLAAFFNVTMAQLISGEE